MREIRRIFLHCTATREGQYLSAEDIRDMHVNPPPVGRGWRDVGYHWIVLLDGTVEPGRDEAKVGAHAEGHNGDSVAIAYVGGLTADGKSPKDTRTPEQIDAIDRTIAGVRERHGQGVTVHGHNEVSSKACPSFDVSKDRATRRR